jgi:hypothetical protein
MNRLAIGGLVLAALCPSAPAQNDWEAIGWNNLGMHCMDSDYSVFSILPPYNVPDFQLIQPDGRLLRVLNGVRVTYEAVADPTGSINRTSIGKTNFWTWVPGLYGGSPVPDSGLMGFPMPGPANTPRPMAFDPVAAVFSAEGIPITPYDDSLHKRPYPLMRLVARNTAGTLLAFTDVVLPVSDEMDCRACHSSVNGEEEARPPSGWAYAPNPERDYRLNILRIHDDLNAENPQYVTFLAQAGYSQLGLHDTVVNRGTPILCAKCHASNVLPGTGFAGVPPLTRSVHAFHANVPDPVTRLPLESETNRSACYRCHPGQETRCLRGAMGNAVAADGSRAIQCQDCHGSMSTVGGVYREGWLAEPTCQNCHTGTALQNNGQLRYTTVFEPGGQVRQAVNATFATNSDVPLPGFSLYRFSTGHGGLRCEACHGSTHAEYPSSHPNDNLQSHALQGHVGTVADCTACHAGSPVTATGGPHGMHPIGQPWVVDHHDVVEHSGAQACRACHGLDYQGSVLGQAQGDRTLTTNNGPRFFWRGYRVTCWSCHNGPNTGDPSPNRPAAVSNAVAFCAEAPATIPLTASDPDGNPLVLRVVSQPAWGRVAISGRTATYHPEPGFAGDDRFTFAAFDGLIDSNLGTVTVTRGASWANYGVGFPGTAGAIPAFTASAAPVLGRSIDLVIGNTSGGPVAAALLASMETANLPTEVGGAFLTEPTAIAPFALSAAGLVLPLAVPDVPGLVGQSVYGQVLEQDPGARFLVAFSRGLRLTFGR